MTIRFKRITPYESGYEVQTPFFYLVSLPLSRWRPLGDRGPRPRETLPGARRRAKLSSRPIGAEPARPVKLTSLAVMSWVFELARRTVSWHRRLQYARACGRERSISHRRRIGKSNGLFHRLLRPPCCPLPATCSARQRVSGGLASVGRRAHQTGLAWPLLARLSHAGGGHRSILQPQASRPGAEPRRLSRR